MASQGQTYMADNDSDSDEARVLRPLQAAACIYRIAFGPRAGQKGQTVQGAMPRDAGLGVVSKLLLQVRSDPIALRDG